MHGKRNILNYNHIACYSIWKLEFRSRWRHFREYCTCQDHEERHYCFFFIASLASSLRVRVTQWVGHEQIVHWSFMSKFKVLTCAAVLLGAQAFQIDHPWFHQWDQTSGYIASDGSFNRIPLRLASHNAVIYGGLYHTRLHTLSNM